MTNGQQRPANPNRITIWHSKPFPDGRPPVSEFSVSAFISLDMLRQLYDAVASGLIQPENNYQGVPGIQLWGNGYRGSPGQSGAPGPVLGGTLNTPKAIYQQQQAAQQQADPIYPGQPVQAPAMAPLPAGTFPQQQVAPAYAAAFPPQATAAPVAPPPAAPAPAPTPRPHPLPGGQWSTAPAPAAAGWKSAAPADEAGLPY